MRSIAFGLTLALVFAIPWEQTLELSGVGTISKALGVAAAAAWGLSVLASGRMRRPSALHAALLAVTIWSGLSIYWSLDPRSSIEGFLTQAQLLVMLLVVWDLVDTRQRVNATLQAYVLGGFVAVGGVVANFVNNTATVWERYSSPGSDVDGAALILALGVPAAIYLAATTRTAGRSRMWTLVNFAYIPAAAFAIALTGTRGAVLASVPTAVFLLWVLARTGPSGRIAGAVALVVSAYLLISLAPETSLQRIGTAFGEFSGGDLTGRVGVWEQSWAAFQAQPLLGVGDGAHRAAIAAGKVAHNTALSVLVETGVLGLVLFGTFIVLLVRQVRSLSGWEARLWVTQLSVILVGSLSLSVEDRKSIWLFLFLAAAAAAAAGSPASGQARIAASVMAPGRRRLTSTGRPVSSPL